MATFLTDVTTFFADLAVDEATDNREGDERDETPRGAMLNADWKIYSSSEYLLYLGGSNGGNNLNCSCNQ